ncbi:MAG: hypothetical protein U0229_03880 [Anaeromyxobacter sp.]
MPPAALARRAAWPALAALVSVTPPLAVLASGHSLVWRDTAQLMGPLRPAIVAALRSGHLPTWNPWEGTGQPLLGQYLHGLLHPVSLAVAAVTDSMDALLVAMVAFAAAGAWAAARTLRASPLAALGTGLAYGLSGYVLGMTSNTQYLLSSATGPWAVAGLVLAATSARGWLAAAAGVAALALSGDPGAIIAYGALGLVLAATEAGPRRAWPALAGAAAGVALAAVQLVPTAVALSDSLRGLGVLSDADRLRWALAPWRLLELVAPGLAVGLPRSYDAPVFAALDGSTPDRFPFAPSVYVGTVVVALAAAGMLRDRRGKVLAGLAAVLLWLALGHWLGAQQALAWVPVWGTLRYWEKLVAPLTLVLALAAAAGVDALAEPDGRRRLLRVCGRGTLGLAIAAGPYLFGSLSHAGGASVSERALIGLAHALLGLALLAGGLFVPARWTAVAAVAAIGLTGLAASPFALHPGSRAALDARPPALDADPPGPRLAAPLGCDYLAGAGALDAADLLALCERRSGRPSTNAASRTDSFPTYSALAPRRWESVLGAGPYFWDIARRFSTTHVVSRLPASEAEARALEAATALAGPALRLDGGNLLVFPLPHRPWASFAPAVVPASGPEAAAEALRARARGGLAGRGARGPGAGGRRAGPHPGPRARGRAPLGRGGGRGGRGARRERRVGAGVARAAIDGQEVAVLPADLLVRAVAWLRRTAPPGDVVRGARPPGRPGRLARRARRVRRRVVVAAPPGRGRGSAGPRPVGCARRCPPALTLPTARAVRFAARDYVTGDAFEVADCGACGLAVTLPTPADLGRYYPAAYYGAAGERRFPAPSNGFRGSFTAPAPRR